MSLALTLLLSTLNSTTYTALQCNQLTDQFIAWTSAELVTNRIDRPQFDLSVAGIDRFLTNCKSKVAPK